MRKAKQMGALVVLVMLNFGGKLLWDAGAFLKINPHFSGVCKRVGPVDGPEDIEVARHLKLAFISSDLRVNPPQSNGAIYALALGDKNAELKKIWQPSFEFHPHGMGIYEDVKQTGIPVTLFLVNHRADRDTVEVIRYTAGQVQYLKTLEDPLLINENDIFAVDANRFYQTHDHGSRAKLLQDLEMYSRIGRGYLTFYDGQKFQLVASGISFPNGIFADPSLTHLFVASMTGKKVLIYDRNPETNQLTFNRQIPLPAAPDNVTLDEQGDLWVAAHPKLLALKKQSENLKALAPAEILRVHSPLTSDPVVEEVFLDDGHRISAASVGVHYLNRLLIGSVFDTTLLDCELEP